jgi:SAM-dependent methyltransferase
MALPFSSFDKRKYRTVGVQDGYAEWAPTYEDTVLDLMDLRLLAGLATVDWQAASNVLDLACGTGRVGVWLRDRGVQHLTGVDFTLEMLNKANEKNVYDALVLADVADTGLKADAYDLVVESLADEHFDRLGPFYAEAARLCRDGGQLVLVGYHPHFVMQGMPTHFNSAAGEPVAVETHVHLMSDHVRAAHSAGFRLAEMIEGVIDDAWLAAKPKWHSFRDHPISFAMVWQKA